MSLTSAQCGVGWKTLGVEIGRWKRWRLPLMDIDEVLQLLNQMLGNFGVWCVDRYCLSPSTLHEEFAKEQ
ncbi:unnamed protein product [Nezara viridula]|uniref:Uncharacterized protein n=1 Tax=Nezara viridula TaxID=85310 RepID=A0A9P0HRJ2_NEZVI|nr:unnamed protein product [Nezara viridula]